MKIELLYFEGCPNHPPTQTLLKKVLHEKGVLSIVQEVNITSEEMAQQERFLGSPSIRINGKDIEPQGAANGKDLGQKCRIYTTPDGPKGIPPRELILKGIERAQRQEGIGETRVKNDH